MDLKMVNQSLNVIDYQRLPHWKCIYSKFVIRPAKINHVSTKNVSSLRYHTLQNIYTNKIKSHGRLLFQALEK